MTTPSDIHSLAVAPSPAPVPLASLREWFESPDAEVQGAAFALLTNRPNFPWSPPLDTTTLDSLARRYFEQRIRNDDGGRWAHSRYEAAWELAGWVARHWFDAVAPGKLATLLDWFGGLYRTGDAGVRRALVDGTLEHLFERKDIKAAFKDWRDDSELSGAYTEAANWAARGGTSPLIGSKPRRKKGK